MIQGSTAQVLKDAIEKTYVPHLQDVVFEGEAVNPPTQLAWYVFSLNIVLMVINHNFYSKCDVQVLSTTMTLSLSLTGTSSGTRAGSPHWTPSGCVGTPPNCSPTQ